MNERADDIWIFAYGSLMWRPGFDHEAMAPALLRGYHRSFCVYSVHYRGTPERRGLVLGLDRGGACRGMAIRLRAGDEPAVLAYLDKREQVTMVYLRRQLPIHLDDGRRVLAWSYVVDRQHDQYAAGLDPAHMAEIIRGASGYSGQNREYLASTLEHLTESGVQDQRLERLLELVDGG